MIKSNIGLIEHCNTALNQKWGYVFGTWGQLLNEKILSQKLSQYPLEVGRYIDYIKKNWIGRRTVDCVGLIKSYLWWDNTNPIYNPKTDVSANMMFDIASKNGTIVTIPQIKGLCVWRKDHIGVYIGSGYVIESKGTMYGVVKTKLSEGSWTHWIKCPFVTYVEEDKLFEDVDENRWSYGDIKKAYDLGLIKGDGEGKFKPKDPLTREQGAVLIVRLYEKILKDMEERR